MVFSGCNVSKYFAFKFLSDLEKDMANNIR